MCKVSIIVPVFNGENYLNKCLDMIINQTFTDFELILIDDGSVDNSEKIYTTYMEYDNRIKIIKKKNAGAWAARNSGIDVAKGKYIMFLDCDDWYENNFIEEMYKTIEESNSDLVICGQTNVFVDKSNKIYKMKNVDIEEYIYNDNNSFVEDYIKMREKGIADVLWNKIYKTKIIKENKIRFQNLKRGEDAVFNINYYENVNKGIILPKYLYKYRVEIDKPFWIKYSTDFYQLLLNENNYISEKLKSSGKYDEKASQYLSQHFVCGMIEHFYWIIYPDNKFTLKDKRNKISEIINKEFFINACEKAELQGIFNKLIVKFIENKNIYSILILIKVKFIMREIYYWILCKINRKNIKNFQ